MDNVKLRALIRIAKSGNEIHQTSDVWSDAMVYFVKSIKEPGETIEMAEVRATRMTEYVHLYNACEIAPQPEFAEPITKVDDPTKTKHEELIETAATTLRRAFDNTITIEKAIDMIKKTKEGAEWFKLHEQEILSRFQ